MDLREAKKKVHLAPPEPLGIIAATRKDGKMHRYAVVKLETNGFDDSPCGVLIKYPVLVVLPSDLNKPADDGRVTVVKLDEMLNDKTTQIVAEKVANVDAYDDKFIRTRPDPEKGNNLEYFPLVSESFLNKLDNSHVSGSSVKKLNNEIEWP